MVIILDFKPHGILLQQFSIRAVSCSNRLLEKSQTKYSNIF